MSQLVKDIDVVTKIEPISSALSFKHLAGYMEEAEDAFVRPILGNTLLDSLAQVYGQEDSNKVLRLAQRVIVKMGLYHALPSLSVRLDSGGLVVDESSNSKRVYGWHFREVHRSLRATGAKSINTLFSYLQANTQTFSDWNENHAKTLRSTFIFSPEQFNQHYYIGEDYFLFTRLLPKMRAIESGLITNILGKEAVQELATLVKENTTNSDLQPIIELCRALIAPEAIARGIQEKIMFSPDGVSLVSSEMTMSGSTGNIEEPASDQLLQLIANRAEGASTRAQKDLRKKANELALDSKFDTYKNSTAYTPESNAYFKNGGNRKYFFGG